MKETTILNDLAREANEFANTVPEDCSHPNGYAYVNTGAGGHLVHLGPECFTGPHLPKAENPERRHESLGAEAGAA